MTAAAAVQIKEEHVSSKMMAVAPPAGMFASVGG